MKLKPQTTTVALHLLITTAILLEVLPLARALPPATTTDLQPATLLHITVAPSPGPDCFVDLADMADCISYVEDGSNMTKPDPGCCPEISNLIDTRPICLCELISNPNKFGFSDIRTSRALQLPSLCNLVKGSPVVLCEAIGVPVTIAPPPTPSQGAAKPYFIVELALFLFTSLL